MKKAICNDNKLKVIWICHFSNEEVRSHMNLKMTFDEKVHRRFYHKSLYISSTDYAQWINNAICEFEKISSVELHIIAPHQYVSPRKCEFKLHGIHYHFFRPSRSILWRSILEDRQELNEYKYKYNRRIIGQYINKIIPDVINLIGHENNYFGNCIFDIDKTKYPVIISLQTLINDPLFAPARRSQIFIDNVWAPLEKKQLLTTPYISTGAAHYKDVILSKVNRSAIVLTGSLCVGEEIDIRPSEKLFDFVFFANSVSKGLTEALECFVRARQRHPSITMNIIGGINDSQKQYIFDILKENNCIDSVTISGKLKTHNDVLNQIKKSRFALIPLKSDIVSGTIREAISRGLPVVTTITSGTPSLNAKRESVLLSEIGDYDAMVNNMSQLLENSELAETLRHNALITFQEKYCNTRVAKNMVEMYNAVYQHFHNNIPIPDELLSR